MRRVKIAYSVCAFTKRLTSSACRDTPDLLRMVLSYLRIVSIDRPEPLAISFRGVDPI